MNSDFVRHFNSLMTLPDLTKLKKDSSSFFDSHHYVGMIMAFKIRQSSTSELLLFYQVRWWGQSGFYVPGPWGKK